VPPPKVESAAVRIDPRPDPVITIDEETAFRRFVRDAFGMRRKQMRRVLREVLGIDAERAGAVLASAGIEPAARPETLSPEDFARVVRAANRDS
jgi:16S rRNA (adenine1518-N6/adenine1519-N6)-dimethyltransferase